MALEACSEIEEIKFDQFVASQASNAVRALFKFGKPLLSSFSLILQDRGFGDEALLELAKRARGLRSIFIVETERM